MKRTVALISCILTVFMLCSWVDPSTVDVYSAQITYSDSSGYPVSNLSGSIQFYLDDYRLLGYDSSGYLYNPTPDYKNGLALISGNTYTCRMAPNGGFQIQQSYYDTYQRNVWVNYNLQSEIIPAGLTLPEYGIIFIVILLVILVVINICMRGFIL